MRNRRIVFLLLFIEIFVLVNVASSSNLINSQQVVSNSVKQTGAYFTGIYSDLFSELLGKSKAEVSAKIDNAFDQLFYGDDNTQRVYYQVAPDMAYIKDMETIWFRSRHRTINRHGKALDRGETFSGIDYNAGLEAVEKLITICPSGMALSQFALRWILMFDAVTCTIPGAKRPSQVEENSSVADMPPLTREKMDQVRAIYDNHIRKLVHQN